MKLDTLRALALVGIGGAILYKYRQSGKVTRPSLLQRTSGPINDRLIEPTPKENPFELGARILQQLHASNDMLRKFVNDQEIILYASKYEMLDDKAYAKLNVQLQDIYKRIAFLQSLDVNVDDITDIGKLNRANIEVASKQLQVSKSIMEILVTYSDSGPVFADMDLVPAFAQNNGDKLIAIINATPKLTAYDQSDARLLCVAYNLKAKVAASLQGDNKSAEEYYKLALENEPTNIVSKVNFILLLIDRGIVEANPSLYLQAYSIYLDSSAYLEQMQPELLPNIEVKIAKGLILLARAIESGQLIVPQKASNGVKRIRENAESLLMKKFHKDTTNPERSICLGMLHFDNKEYAQARQKFGFALAFQPLHPEALMRMGFCLKASGTRYDEIEALEYLQKAEQQLDTAIKASDAHDSYRAINSIYSHEVKTVIMGIPKRATQLKM